MLRRTHHITHFGQKHVRVFAHIARMAGMRGVERFKRVGVGVLEIPGSNLKIMRLEVQ